MTNVKINARLVKLDNKTNQKKDKALSGNIPDPAMDGREAPEGPRSIEEQRDLLAEVQVRHFDRITASGLAAKVKGVLGVEQDENVGQLLVTSGQQIVGDPEAGERIGVYRVSAGKLYYAENPDVGPRYHHVDVAQVVDGIVAPVEGEVFSWDDADEVVSMGRELEGLRNDGILPNLSVDLRTVDNPSTGLMRREPEKSE